MAASTNRDPDLALNPPGFSFLFQLFLILPGKRTEKEQSSQLKRNHYNRETSLKAMRNIILYFRLQTNILFAYQLENKEKTILIKRQFFQLFVYFSVLTKTY